MRLHVRDIPGQVCSTSEEEHGYIVLVFSKEKWQSLKVLREADGTESHNAAVTVTYDNIAGEFEEEDQTNQGNNNKEAM